MASPPSRPSAPPTPKAPAAAARRADSPAAAGPAGPAAPAAGPKPALAAPVAAPKAASASGAGPAAGQAARPGMPRRKLVSWRDRAALLEGEQHIEVDVPAPGVSRITLNRPEVRNAMSNRTRAQLVNQLQVNDQDPDVRVTIIRGAGGNFCAGFDFDTARDEPSPFFEAEGDGQASRSVLNTFFSIMDLGKPVVAQVEGAALGGGLELAAACDVCVAAEDAVIGYAPVRGQGLPDFQILPWLCGMRNAMEMMLLNQPMSGTEAAHKKFATFAVPRDQLEAKTLEFAVRIAKIPADLLAFNKRSVQRSFEIQGMRTNLRNAVDLEALMFKANGAKMLTVRRGPTATASAGLAPGARAPAAPRAAHSGEDSVEDPTELPPRATSPVLPEPPAAAAGARGAAAAPGPALASVPGVRTCDTEPSADDRDASAARRAQAAAPRPRPAMPASAAKPSAASPAKPAAPAAAAAASPAKSKPAAPAAPAAASPAKPKPAAPGAASAPKTPARAAPPQPPAVAKPAPARPAAATAAAAAAQPAETAVAEAAAPARASPRKPAQAAQENGVHVHLHEAVHIHIDATRSKI